MCALGNFQLAVEIFILGSQAASMCELDATAWFFFFYNSTAW